MLLVAEPLVVELLSATQGLVLAEAEVVGRVRNVVVELVVVVVKAKGCTEMLMISGRTAVLLPRTEAVEFRTAALKFGSAKAMTTF